MPSPHATIVASLIQGQNVRWAEYHDYSRNHHLSRPLGSPAVVTYSFSSSVQPYFSATTHPGFRPLTEAERGTVRAAAAQWDRVSGLSLIEVGAGRGDIQIGNYDFRGTPAAGNDGYAFYPGPDMGGDVWFNSANPGSSSVTLELALHELGHALGLKHPFDPGLTGTTLPTDEDRRSLTLMSYTTDRPSDVLGPYDVAAIQYLYGPDVSLAATLPGSFTPTGYLAANPDLLAAFGGPNEGAATLHYAVNGMREGRPVTFDALRYIASHPDLIDAFGANEAAGTAHYVHHGATEGRSARSFSPLAYIASYSDLKAAFSTDARAAEMHYIACGRNEGRTVTFDAYGYLASNADVLVTLGSDPDVGALHYLQHGQAEGRSSTGFNAASYLRLNPDVAAAFGSSNTTAAVWHYVEHGWREGRPTIEVPTRPALAQAFAADELQGMTALELSHSAASDVFASDAAAFSLDTSHFPEQGAPPVWLTSSTEFGLYGDRTPAALHFATIGLAG